MSYTLAVMGKSAVVRARFEWASDQSILVYFDAEATSKSNEKSHAETSPDRKRDSLAAHESVRKLVRLLDAEPIAGVRNFHPGYESVLVKFDGATFAHAHIETALKKYLGRMDKIDLPAPQAVEIPVCYGGEFGPDLEDVASAHRITKERVIELHTARTYLVYFLGFVPGFAYLGELPVELVTPRLPTPRRNVPAGSVGIAGNQTGVYPFATPGGWRLLGRTPLKVFQADRPGLSLLAIGDHVKFRSISPQQFSELDRA